MSSKSKQDYITTKSSFPKFQKSKHESTPTTTSFLKCHQKVSKNLSATSTLTYHQNVSKNLLIVLFQSVTKK